MTNTREERVARLLCEQNTRRKGVWQPGDEKLIRIAVGQNWQRHLSDAREIIAALSVEPSPDVWEATARDALQDICIVCEGQGTDRFKVQRVYRIAATAQALARKSDPPKVTVDRA